MVLLTNTQAALLAWMVESGTHRFLFAEVYGGEPQTIRAEGGSREEHVIVTEDLNELVSAGLVRHTSEVIYELTNQGMIEIQERTALPAEPRSPAGFQPD